MPGEFEIRNSPTEAQGSAFQLIHYSYCFSIMCQCKFVMTLVGVNITINNYL